MKSEVRGNNVHIYGTLIYSNGLPNVGCLIRIHEINSDEEVGRTTTDKLGYYHIIIPIEKVSSGYYVFKTYGSKTKPYYKPLGDWESFWLETGTSNDVIPPDYTLISGIDNV